MGDLQDSTEWNRAWKQLCSNSCICLGLPNTQNSELYTPYLEDSMRMLWVFWSSRCILRLGRSHPSCNHFIPLRVHVHKNWVLGFWVVVMLVQVLGKYMIIRYLDPYGT